VVVPAIDVVVDVAGVLVDVDVDDEVVDDEVVDDDGVVVAGAPVVGGAVVGAPAVVEVPGALVGLLTGLGGGVGAVGRGRVAGFVVVDGEEEVEVEEVDVGEGIEVVVAGASRGSASRAASIDVNVVLAGSDRRQRTNGFSVDDVDVGTSPAAFGFGDPLPEIPASSMTIPRTTNATAAAATLPIGKVRVRLRSAVRPVSPAPLCSPCAAVGG
jgi:hypothetical protein